MGEAGLAKELWRRKGPGTRAVAGRPTGFEFSPPLGDRRVGPAERPGDLLQLPGKIKWPKLSPLTLSKVRLLLHKQASRIFALEQIGKAEIESKRGSKVIRPARRKDVGLLHLLASFLRSLGMGGGLAFAFQQVGVEGFYAQGINQQRATASSLPQNLDKGVGCGASSREHADRCAESARSGKIRLDDRQGPAPVDDDRRRRGLHNPNTNTKKKDCKPYMCRILSRDHFRSSFVPSEEMKKNPN